MDVPNCSEQGKTAWSHRQRVKLGGKPHPTSSNMGAGFFVRRPVAVGHSCPSCPSLQSLPWQQLESKVLHWCELVLTVYCCPDSLETFATSGAKQD